MLDNWRFILANSPPIGSAPGQPLIKIGELDQARNREIEFGLNRSGNAKGSLSMFDDLAYEFFTGSPKRGTIRRSIIAMRGSEHIWSGPIVTLDGSAPELIMNFNAVGWFEFLNYRELRQDLNFVGDNPLTGQKWTDVDIAFALLDEANNQDPFRPTWISKGIASGPRQERERKYTRGQKIGPLIHELSEAENGYDYEVDPITRALNIYGAGSGKGVDKPDANFGYYYGPGNLEKWGFAEDGLSTMNYMLAYGNQGVTPGLANDEVSMNAYGIFQETANLTNVGNSDLLAAYAGTEVAIRSLPRLTYTINPFPWHPDLPIPRIFTDFTIGDRGRLSINAGAISVFKQHIRFYGASISIPEVGTERITKLDISPL
jgi:hypothetical protein